MTRSTLFSNVARVARNPAQGFNFVGIVLIHVFAIVAFSRGVTLSLVLLALATYAVRMFAITGVYHRYFSHRAYKTSRAMQFFLAVLGTTATQKGPLWWASVHRIHHKFSDTEDDVHSPVRKGFFYSHMGWWLSDKHAEAPLEMIPDFAAYPELRWLDKYHVLAPLSLIAALAFFGGYDAVLWGYVVSTCFLMHAVFAINSVAHVLGSRRYATTDTSRNNVVLALLTFGEGWHNNHHHYMNSANQGFFWWEIDISFYVLRLMEKLGLVWELRRPPAHMLAKNLLADVGERAPLMLGRPEAPAPAAAVVMRAPTEASSSSV